MQIAFHSKICERLINFEIYTHFIWNIETIPSVFQFLKFLQIFSVGTISNIIEMRYVSRALTDWQLKQQQTSYPI